MRTKVREGRAYLRATSWDLIIGTLHRVWISAEDMGIDDESATLWGWDWWWQR